MPKPSAAGWRRLNSPFKTIPAMAAKKGSVGSILNCSPTCIIAISTLSPKNLPLLFPRLSHPGPPNCLPSLRRLAPCKLRSPRSTPKSQHSLPSSTTTFLGLPAHHLPHHSLNRPNVRPNLHLLLP